MTCNSCGAESADTFNYCPKCGQCADSSLNQTTEAPNDSAGQTDPLAGISGWTVVFASLAFVSLLVSLVKGVVPVYLIESAAWAALAWYWQKQKISDETGKGGTIVVMSALVLMLQLVWFISQSSKAKQTATSVNTSQSVSQSGDSWKSYAVAPCPSGLPSGATIQEIPPDQITATNGQLWYSDPDRDLGDKGGWYFHFSVSNHTKDFCITAVAYRVQLELPNGAIIDGHGRKQLNPLSPGRTYTPQQRDSDDQVTFQKLTVRGTLNAWSVQKVYGFVEPHPVGEQ